MFSNRDESGLASLGCCLGVLLMNLILGSWSVNVILLTFLGKTIPWIGAALIGLVAGEISVPVALVITILKWFGVL